MIATKLKDIVSFNPKRSIKKGNRAPFIEMASLNTNSRDVET